MSFSRRTSLKLIVGAAGAMAMPALLRAQTPTEIRIDFATYNPVSLVLREQKLLEQDLGKDGITVRWVQSAGSNKALEFLNAGSLDFGSTAGAAALIGRINGNPIRSVYVYSRPEWTALVTRPETGITKVADLKGKRVAVTRGTDPHIFLVRQLAKAGLTERDVRLVLLQHADGRAALIRGDVDAWAGLDPMMAAAEIDNAAVLFHRDASANTWGILNVREEFADRNPALTRRILGVYERARRAALADKALVERVLVEATRLPAPVIQRQLERTELTHSRIGTEQAETIIAAGLALQEAGVLKPETDIKATVAALIDQRHFPVA